MLLRRGSQYVFIQNESLARRRESPLNLHVVVYMQHLLFFVLFYLYRKCHWWRKVLHFSRSRIVKKHHFPVNVILSLWLRSDEIIMKTEQHGKAETGNSEWTRSLIHRSASVNQLRGVSDEHVINCKRKFTGKNHESHVCDDCQNTNRNWTSDALTWNNK